MGLLWLESTSDNWIEIYQFCIRYQFYQRPGSALHGCFHGLKTPPISMKSQSSIEILRFLRKVTQVNLYRDNRYIRRRSRCIYNKGLIQNSSHHRNQPKPGTHYQRTCYPPTMISDSLNGARKSISLNHHSVGHHAA